MSLRTFALSVLLSSSSFFYTPSIFGEDLSVDPYGQQSLRNDWHRISPFEPDRYENFKRERNLIEIAEDRWLRDLPSVESEALASQNQSYPSFVSKDLPLSFFLIRKTMTDAAWRLDRTIYSTIHLIQLGFERPFEFLSLTPGILDAVLPPIIFALVLILSLHLWLWAPAILQSLPTFFSSRTTLLLMAIFIGSLAWAIRLGAIPWFIHFLILACLIFSRRATPFIVLSILSAAWISLSPAFRAGTQIAEEVVPLEALNHGRTRIEYDFRSLEKLPPLAKAIWAALNRSLLQSQYWMNQLPESKDRDLLQVVLARSEGLRADRTRSLLEGLATKYPNDAVIQFNLIQTLIQTQNLVKADELRSQISSRDYERLFASIKNRSEQSLAFPELPPASYEFFSRLELRALEALKNFYLHPFHWLWGSLHLVWFLLPWFFIFIAIIRRPFAKGICSQTGEPTLRVSSEYAPIYLAVTQVKDTGSQNLRQQVDRLTREHMKRQHWRESWYRFFILDARSLVFDQYWQSSFWKTSFLFSFLWWGIPSHWRSCVLNSIGINAPKLWSPHSGGVLFLALFVGFYIWNFWTTRRGT